jgi:hypothetical protein
MAFIENGKDALLMGLALGAGVAAVARGMVPAIRDTGRPLAKAALKSSFLFFERTRETLAEWSEEVEDLLAEVQAEVEAEAEGEAESEAESEPKARGDVGTAQASAPAPETKAKRKPRARKTTAAPKKRAT